MRTYMHRAVMCSIYWCSGHFIPNAIKCQTKCRFHYVYYKTISSDNFTGAINKLAPCISGMHMWQDMLYN